jgi:hypothetical protein
MSGARQPERHDRDETLSAGQNAPVLGAELSEHTDRLIDRYRDVTNERRGLHEPNILRESQSNDRHGIDVDFIESNCTNSRDPATFHTSVSR